MEEIQRKPLDKEEVMRDFLKFIDNELQDEKLVLKGGGALHFCYGMDRQSNDLDFDEESKMLEILVPKFCEKYGYKHNLKKSGEFAERYMIDYGGDKPLKVESSLRNRNILDEVLVKKNDILTYEFNYLVSLKLQAYSSRDKIRDAYDIAYVTSERFNELDPRTRMEIANALSEKGLENLDYLLANQGDDDLIDVDRLIDLSLKGYDNLGLLISEKERKDIENNKKEPEPESDPEPGSDFF